MAEGPLTGRRCGWFAWLTMLGLTAGCVGSESRDAAGRESSASGDRTREASVTVRSDWDSIRPLPYHVFERRYSADSTRVLTRFLVLTAADGDVLSKTLMLALDSLGEAEGGLVAARGILYRAVPGSSGQVRAAPAVWGEWVPPQGWEAPAESARGEVHRTFIYRMDPGWGPSDTALTMEAEDG